MKKILIANIGNRNIKYKNNYILELVKNINKAFNIEKSQELYDELTKYIDKSLVKNIIKIKTKNNKIDFKTFTEILFNQYNKCKDSITIEILNKLLNCVKFDNVYLIVTNQEKSNSEYTQQDTIYVGKILKKKIKEIYNYNTIIKEYPGNPTNYEEIHMFFTKFINNEISRSYKDDKIVICDSGGTPQLKDGLRYSSVFLRNVTYYAVEQFSGKINEISIKEIYKTKAYKHAAIDLINLYGYIDIIKLLSELELEGEDFEVTINLLNYLVNRINLNFKKANKYYEKIKNKINSQYLIRLEETKQRKLIELYWNLYIKWVRNEYADFIARLYSFVNNTAILLLEKDIGMELKGNEDKLKNILETALPKDELRHFMPNGKFKLTVESIVAYFKDKYKRDMEHFLTIKKRIINLTRHHSYIAHGFDPVSKENIVNPYYTEENLFNDLKKIIKEVVNINDLDINPYAELNKDLKDYIKKL